MEEELDESNDLEPVEEEGEEEEEVDDSYPGEDPAERAARKQKTFEENCAKMNESFGFKVQDLMKGSTTIQDFELRLMLAAWYTQKPTFGPFCRTGEPPDTVLFPQREAPIDQMTLGDLEASREGPPGLEEFILRVKQRVYDRAGMEVPPIRTDGPIC